MYQYDLLPRPLEFPVVTRDTNGYTRFRTWPGSAATMDVCEVSPVHLAAAHRRGVGSVPDPEYKQLAGTVHFQWRHVADDPLFIAGIVGSRC